MKKIVAASLILSLSNLANGAEQFAGIFFDSSVPANQVRTLKEDLTYLYQNPFKQTDPELKNLTGVAKVDGAHMYNWVYNRVRYILGEQFNTSRNIVTQKGHKFPSTPLPKLSSHQSTNSYSAYGAVMIMSNIGAELYLNGKSKNTLWGLKINGKKVFAPSPRVGILQVGEGLFLEKLSINGNVNSEANKIKRLGTLIHEARHSDGNSEHIGFHHNKCPTGHALSGFYACESSANGSYTVEASATKTLLLNCRTCSEEDKTKLQTQIADSLSRVVVRSHVKTEAQLLSEIETFQKVVTFYEDLLSKNPNLEQTYREELTRLRNQLQLCQDQLKELRTPIEPKKLDPKPEGIYQEATVEQSSNLMNASLKK